MPSKVYFANLRAGTDKSNKISKIRTLLMEPYSSVVAKKSVSRDCELIVL